MQAIRFILINSLNFGVFFQQPAPNVCQGFHFQPISRTVSIISYRKIIYNLMICIYDVDVLKQ